MSGSSQKAGTGIFNRLGWRVAMERTLEEGSHGIWKGYWALLELPWLRADLGNRAPLKFLETPEDWGEWWLLLRVAERWEVKIGHLLRT